MTNNCPVCSAKIKPGVYKITFKTGITAVYFVGENYGKEAWIQSPWAAGVQYLSDITGIEKTELLYEV